MAGGFEGKAVVVTGGTQGIGQATARLVAERGARAVAICGRDAERGEAVARALREIGPDAIFVRADLSRPEDCFTVIDTAAERFGELDSLINCSGVAHRGTLEETDVEMWDYLFAVNVRSLFLLAQRIVPIIRAHGRGGTIASIGSVAVHGGQPYLVAYSAAKAALVVLSKNLANGLRWDRIRVNVLNIGWTATPAEHELQANYHRMGDDWLERMSKQQPFGRLLSPEDVAKALAFIASDESGLMTGASIDFDQKVIGAVDDNPVAAARADGTS